MPRRRAMTLDEFDLFIKMFASRLTVAPEQVRDAVDRGAALEIEESLFGDPGDDFVDLMLDGALIARVYG